MTVTYCGEMSIDSALPGASVAGVAGAAGINAALPDILERIAALTAFSPQPVSFAAQLALANQMVAGIQLSISLGIPPPSILAQIAAVTALVSELLASVVAINASLVIVTDFLGLLAAAGIHVFAFAGTVSALGAELDTATAAVPVSGAGNAVVLLTTTPATWTALSQIVKVTP